MRTWNRNFILSSLLISVASFAGDIQGNGGDFIAQEFAAHGFEALKVLKELKTLPADLSLQDLEHALSTTQVVSADKTELPGPDGKPLERDAINLPDETPPTILVNRTSWTSKKLSTTDKMSLALHEYLGIVGTERNNYRISSQLRVFMNGTSNSGLSACPKPDQDGNVSPTLIQQYVNRVQLAGVITSNELIEECFNQIGSYLTLVQAELFLSGVQKLPKSEHCADTHAPGFDLRYCREKAQRANTVNRMSFTLVLNPNSRLSIAEVIKVAHWEWLQTNEILFQYFELNFSKLQWNDIEQIIHSLNKPHFVGGSNDLSAEMVSSVVIRKWAEKGSN